MSRKLHALLIGINDYPNVNKLYGCVNDVRTMVSFLEENYQEMQPSIKILLDAQATRQNIIDGFRAHLGQAQPGDTVYFHFSGHGSREQAPKEFHPFFPEQKNETLVCYDSRSEDGYDLADKELAVLIKEVSKEGNVHVVVVLDCCHSGSGTRNSLELLANKRQAAKEGNQRTLGSYLDGYYQQMLNTENTIALPVAPHILLSACRASEVAWETNQRQGLFSQQLLWALKQNKGKLSYAELFRQIRASIRQIAHQNPQFELYGNTRAYDYFLTQLPKANEPQYQIYYDSASQTWRSDVGALQGMPTEYPEQIRLQTYPENEADFLASNVLAELVATEVRQNETVFAPPLTHSLDTSKTYVGVVANMPPPAITLHNAASGDFALTSSFLFDEVEQPDLADYFIRKVSDKYRIVHRLSKKIIVEDTNNDYINDGLRKIALWENTRNLANPKTSFSPDSLEVALYVTDDQGNELRLLPEPDTQEFSFNLTEGQRISCVYKLTNHSQQDLFVAGLVISPLYGVYFVNQKLIPAGSTASFNPLINGQEPVKDSIGFWPGTERDNESIVQIKYLITTQQEIDTFALRQEDFSINQKTRNAAATIINKARFMGSKGIAPVQKNDDWFTKDIFFRLVKPIQQIEQNVTLMQGQTSTKGGLKINAPEGFKANISVSNPTNAMRGIQGQGLFYKHFASDKDGLELFSFNQAGQQQGFSVIELSEIVGELSDEDTLEIVFDQPLEPEEVIIPFSFDGEDMLPIGIGEANNEGQTTVYINHLPEEQVKSRSIGRALKFSLYKIARKVFKKQEPDWNQLKAWEFSANDGKFMGYEEEDSAIQAQVKAAKKILLLVHGVIGNTDGMLDFATQLCKAGCYDLVLTFDYENLNTPIADIALYLKLRLVGDAAPHKEVKYDGIGLGENKKIDVLAHSMGGLVVRHFIEMQGGHQYINRLIMCGTPNGGSAFGKIDDYVKFASIGLTIAIGVLSPLKLPLKIAGFIANLRTIKSGVGVTNMLTRTLQDMKPDSTFLRQLNASPSNQVKYDVLAGDIYKYASQSHPNARIIARIYNKLLKWVGSWVYGNAPNDIAVRVKDINLTKAGQTVTNQGVVCHHLNYFSEEDCVELLKRVLCELDATS